MKQVQGDKKDSLHIGGKNKKGKENNRISTLKAKKCVQKEKDENERIKSEYNNGNPFAGASNYHLTKHCKAAICLSAKRELRLLELSLSDNTSDKLGALTPGGLNILKFNENHSTLVDVHKGCKAVARYIKPKTKKIEGK